MSQTTLKLAILTDIVVEVYVNLPSLPSDMKISNFAQGAMLVLVKDVFVQSVPLV